MIIFIATAFGLAAGSWLGYLGGNAVAKRLGGQQFLRSSAGLGAALTLLPTCFVAFVVGGSLGGGYGEALLGSVGVPLGLGMGIAFVLAAGIVLGAFAGAMCGRLILSARSRPA